ncbi:MAG: peptidase Ste24p [Polaromonas sp.]|nr:peptidase Ste24p [Polaromonas sp.]
MRFFRHQEEARAQTGGLLVLFVLTVTGLVLAVNAGLALTWRVVLPGGGYPAYFFTVNSGLTLLFVLGGWWVETSHLQGPGERFARRAGAREARPSSREREQQLCNIVNELAIAASMTPPTPMVLDRVKAINAFPVAGTKTARWWPSARAHWISSAVTNCRALLRMSSAISGKAIPGSTCGLPAWCSVLR